MMFYDVLYDFYLCYFFCCVCLFLLGDLGIERVLVDLLGLQSTSGQISLAYLQSTSGQTQRRTPSAQAADRPPRRQTGLQAQRS
jgi:hypothetical protein